MHHSLITNKDFFASNQLKTFFEHTNAVRFFPYQEAHTRLMAIQCTCNSMAEYRRRCMVLVGPMVVPPCLLVVCRRHPRLITAVVQEGEEAEAAEAEDCPGTKADGAGEGGASSTGQGCRFTSRMLTEHLAARMTGES